MDEDVLVDLGEREELREAVLLLPAEPHGLPAEAKLSLEALAGHVGHEILRVGGAERGDVCREDCVRETTPRDRREQVALRHERFEERALEAEALHEAVSVECASAAEDRRVSDRTLDRALILATRHV